MDPNVLAWPGLFDLKAIQLDALIIHRVEPFVDGVDGPGEYGLDLCRWQQQYCRENWQLERILPQG